MSPCEGPDHQAEGPHTAFALARHPVVPALRVRASGRPTPVILKGAVTAPLFPRVTSPETVPLSPSPVQPLRESVVVVITTEGAGELLRWLAKMPDLSAVTR